MEISSTAASTAPVVPAQAVPAGAGESVPGMLPLRSRPASGAKGDGMAVPVSDMDSTSGAASPRLDSLEEKLAEIERQFG